jgi:hypothetical protein
MPDDYLWDRSGKPDPEVARLERLLAPLGHRGEMPPPVRHQRSRSRLVGAVLALAAAFLVVMGVALWRGRVGLDGTFEVARVSGAPRIGTGAVGHRTRLAPGEWLVTDAGSRAHVDMGVVGQLEVEPDTRLGLVRTGARGHWLDLWRGTVHAVIWAPPGSFVMNMPSAAAVDLGCAYTLQVDDSGAGLVSVSSGWVGFVWGGYESFVPAGALCATRPGRGPGTPWRSAAPESFRLALEALDFDSLSASEHDAALARVLAEADTADAFTLWHLLRRERGAALGRVYDRLATLAPPPLAKVSRYGILHGDFVMRDDWWNSLGLGDVKLWRTYETRWAN